MELVSVYHFITVQRIPLERVVYQTKQIQQTISCSAKVGFDIVYLHHNKNDEEILWSKHEKILLLLGFRLVKSTTVQKSHLRGNYILIFLQQTANK